MTDEIPPFELIPPMGTRMHELMEGINAFGQTAREFVGNVKIVLDKAQPFVTVPDPFAAQREAHDRGLAAQQYDASPATVGTTRKPRKPGTRQPTGRAAAGTRFNRRHRTVPTRNTDAQTWGKNPPMDNEKRICTVKPDPVCAIHDGKHEHSVNCAHKLT